MHIYLGVVAKQCESKIPPESEGGELAPPRSVSKSRNNSRWWWWGPEGGGGTLFGASKDTPPRGGGLKPRPPDILLPAPPMLPPAAAAALRRAAPHSGSERNLKKIDFFIKPMDMGSTYTMASVVVIK